MDEHTNNMLQGMLEAIVTITEKHKVEPEWENPTSKNKDARGEIECPACKGKLHYSIASYNGHIWGKCETEKCLEWMM